MENSRQVRYLLVTVAVLVGVIVGQVSGLLTALGGSSLPAAFVAGGVGFTGAVSLALLIIKSLGAL